MVDKPKPTKSSEDSSLFFATVSRTTLAISKVAAGAGVLGLLGFAALSVVAGVFFVTENYFVSMCALSIALLVYVTYSNLLSVSQARVAQGKLAFGTGWWAVHAVMLAVMLLMFLRRTSLVRLRLRH